MTRFVKSKGIFLIILVSMFSNLLFSCTALAANAESILSVTYLSQLTPEQWVAQWYEHMKKPEEIISSMNCGPTVLVMLEAYFKQIAPTPERILEVDEFIYDSLNTFQGEYPKTYTRPPQGYEYTGAREGVNTADMQTILKEFMGFDEVVLSTGNDLEDIKSFLNQGSPVIIPVNRIYAQKSEAKVYHFTLIRGYDEERFYANDPGKPDAIGSQANFSFEELEQIWQPGNRILTVLSDFDVTAVEIPQENVITITR